METELKIRNLSNNYDFLIYLPFQFAPELSELGRKHFLLLFLVNQVH